MTARVLIDGHMLGSGETGNETYVRGLLAGLEELGRRELVAVAGPDVDVGAHQPVVLPRRSDIARLTVDLAAMARDHDAERHPHHLRGAVHDHRRVGRDRPRRLVPAPPGVVHAPRPRRCSTPACARRCGERRACSCPRDTRATSSARSSASPRSASWSRPRAWTGASRRRTATRRSRAHRRLLPPPRHPPALRAGARQPAAAQEPLAPRGGLGAARPATEPTPTIASSSPAASAAAATARPRGRSPAGIGDRVVFPGFIRPADLPALYAGASLFVFPSLYEGFGLPVLEAMACGTPVACSRTTSLPEVAGGAAALFDPEDPRDIAAVVGALLADAGLRADLARARPAPRRVAPPGARAPS